MSEEKEKATMSISCDVDCPDDDCMGYMDLFEIDDLVEEGWLHKQILGNEKFGCTDLGIEVKCNECGKMFKVGVVEW